MNTIGASAYHYNKANKANNDNKNITKNTTAKNTINIITNNHIIKINDSKDNVSITSNDNSTRTMIMTYILSQDSTLWCKFLLLTTTVISLFAIWFRLSFEYQAQSLKNWEMSDSGMLSYVIAMKFSLTTMITVLIQHLYYYKLFKSLSDSIAIANSNLAVSIIVPALLGAGVGAGIMTGGIGAGVGTFIGAIIGFALKSIWGDSDKDSKTINHSSSLNKQLLLWIVQFACLSIFIITGILTCALASSSSRYGTYVMLFASTRLVVVYTSCCYYLSSTEPEVFNPLIGFSTNLALQLTQVTAVYDFIPASDFISLIFKIIAYVLCVVYIARFVYRNISYFLVNKSFIESDLPQFMMIFGLILYTIAINIINRDVYTLTSTDDVSTILIQRLYAFFLSLLYFLMAPSFVVVTEITNMIFNISRSKAEESTKYQILSKVIPKHLMKMTIDRRLLPADHYNVCVFYTNIGNNIGTINSFANGDAIGVLKLMNDVNCIMNICMDLCKVNRVESNGNSYLAEAGVAYNDTLINNINLILNFSVLVRESLKRILTNPLEVRMAIHCGHCVGGLIHTNTLVPSFCLLGDMINAVKTVESQGTNGQILITESVRNQTKQTLNLTESVAVELDIATSIKGLNTSAKGLIKTYVFNDFRRPKNFEGLISQVVAEFEKQMPIVNVNNGYIKPMKSKKGSSDISDEQSFSDLTSNY